MAYTWGRNLLRVKAESESPKSETETQPKPETLAETIHAAKNTLGEGQIILYIMASQMYKSKLFCTSQNNLYIPN